MIITERTKDGKTCELTLFKLPLNKQTNKQKIKKRKSGVRAYNLKKINEKTKSKAKQNKTKTKILILKTHLSIQVDKKAKCNIIHSFCFEHFFLSTMSTSYLKSCHGI